MRRRSIELTKVVVGRLDAMIAPRDVLVSPDDAPQVLLDLEPHHTRSLARIVAVVVAIVAGLVWLNRPVSTTSAQTLSTGVPLTAASIAASLDVVVDVEGDVRRPGLVTLPPGSRVADAIKAAGGFSRKDVAGSINLAARIEDGQQIVVGEVAAGTGGASDSTVSLNSGNEADFDSLPGVGPVLAGRIVAWRTEHKRFTAIDELQEVPGIGPKVFANLKDLVRL